MFFSKQRSSTCGKKLFVFRLQDTEPSQHMFSARLRHFVRTQNQRNAPQCSGSHSEPLPHVLRPDLLLLCFTCFAQGHWVSSLWIGSPHGFSLPATVSTLWILTGTATFVVVSTTVFVKCTERQCLFT